MAVSAQAITLSSGSSIEGDVDLVPGVSLGPGVRLGAGVGCRLVISAGVCLGAGVVVQAHGGDLVLEPGVSVGSGVLIVGHGSIGQHTCIGSNATIINPALGASQVVAPGALLGDPGQSAAGAAAQGDPRGVSEPALNGSSQNGSATVLAGTSQPSPLGAANGSGSVVYGKAHVNRLLTTLFPHRQVLNDASLEDRS